MGLGAQDRSRHGRKRQEEAALVFTVLYLTRSLLSRMDPGARLGLGGGARACRLDSFFGFLVLPGLVDLIRFAVFAKNRTSGRHRLAPPGFV